MQTVPWLISLLVIAFVHVALPAEPPTRDEVVAALHQATTFQHEQASRHGGYVYASSAELSLREGEGKTDDDTIWVQPPGTPAVGEAFLDAYDATGDEIHLKAAQDAGHALLLGQRQSGGWYYSISFAPEERKKALYRLDLAGDFLPERVSPQDRQSAGGWAVWKRRKYEGNLTILDDDVTQAATRFLMRLDQTLDFQDDDVHLAALYALQSLLTTQYPNGGWSASWDRFQMLPPSEQEYPIVKATFPQTWSKTWPKDFTGCYVTNDELMSRVIDTLLRAHDVYDDGRYLDAARRAGDFLILAQLPDPQPAWAQQYDANMQPVWSRAFEPPAISGRESQEVIATLIRLHAATGDAKYLEPIPKAIAYLRSSLRPDGRLARFYELETNRPIYFTRQGGGRHELTYSDDRLASGYGYIVDSRLDDLEAAYKAATQAETPPAPSTPDAETVRKVIAALDDRGAWVEPGRLQHHKVAPPGGVIRSATFTKNVSVLCSYLRSLPRK